MELLLHIVAELKMYTYFVRGLKAGETSKIFSPEKKNKYLKSQLILEDDMIQIIQSGDFMVEHF